MRMVRKEIAAEQGVPPFVVFSDQTLKEMSGKQPVNDDELLSIKGVGEQKEQNTAGFFTRNTSLCKDDRLKKQKNNLFSIKNTFYFLCFASK